MVEKIKLSSLGLKEGPVEEVMVFLSVGVWLYVTNLHFTKTSLVDKPYKMAVTGSDDITLSGRLSCEHVMSSQVFHKVPSLDPSYFQSTLMTSVTH